MEQELTNKFHAVKVLNTKPNFDKIKLSVTICRDRYLYQPWAQPKTESKSMQVQTSRAKREQVNTTATITSAISNTHTPSNRWMEYVAAAVVRL